MELTRKGAELEVQRCRSGRCTSEEAQDATEVARDRPGNPSGLIRILRLGQVKKMTGLGKTKIYELQAQEDFPMRVQLTGHSVGWIEAEVQAWLQRRMAARGDAATFDR